MIEGTTARILVLADSDAVAEQRAEPVCRIALSLCASPSASGGIAADCFEAARSTSAVANFKATRSAIWIVFSSWSAFGACGAVAAAKRCSTHSGVNTSRILPIALEPDRTNMRVLKVIVAPPFKKIDGTEAFSAPSAKMLRNRRFRSNYLGHAHR